MHLDLFALATERTAERTARAARRRELLLQPRPPGRWRHRVGAALVRVGARLTDEPVIALPRGPRRVRRERLVRRA
ncbi:hypothetical protein [Nitriliruptor alkaliphilus]|uniref:hypothetical protein n=1 Tax=Nitriliruptor alkaliphilus TaxID=427918 RepID=UPI00069670D5|nr:hypothetical protein [Nitriliruptor alkaliphilus]